MDKIDEQFYNRADAHIDLANAQLTEQVKPGMVSASSMYANARFCAWVSASGCESKEHMADSRDDIIAYFMSQYQKMLEDHLDDHITHFDTYMKADG